MAFPQTPLSVIVELMLNGTWTDVTDHVYLRDGIKIDRGQSDWASHGEPTKCTLTVNNRDGRFTPRNPVGTYYGAIGRNTPIRVGVNTGASYLATTGTTGSNNGASTPDAAALDITGDIDIRFEATLSNWNAAGSIELCGKGATTGNQRSWLLLMRDGALHFEWSTAGTTTIQVDANALLPLPPSGRLAVRVTLDVNNGASGNTTTFYTSDSISGAWTQLGTAVVNSGTTSIFNSSAPVRVGDGWGDLGFPCSLGAVHAFELRNGIGGSVVANPNFTVQTPGASSFVDGTGKTWTVGSSTTISNKKVRFYGEVSSWPSRWDVSGKDVYVQVEAAGVTRRLGQGAAPLNSALRRSIEAAGPEGYWPMEDLKEAVQAASPIKGVRPMRVSEFTFEADDTLPGSAALPTIVTSTNISHSTMSGAVPTGTLGNWHAEMVFRIDKEPTGLSALMQVYTPSGSPYNRHRVYIQPGNIRIISDKNDGTITSPMISVSTSQIAGHWNRVYVDASTSGGTVTLILALIPVDGIADVGSTTYSGSAGRVSLIASPFDSSTATDLEGMRIGHVGAFDASNVKAYELAADGHAGETAGDRLARLGAEEGVSIRVFGDPAGQEAMGAQKQNTLLELFNECADADHGILYEDRGSADLLYRDRNGLYNQPVTLALDYAAGGEVDDPLEPVDDDQGVRNDRTVTRAGGSFARAVQETGPLNVQQPQDDPQGVGRYDDSTTLNLYDDDQPEQHAGWLLHLGTWDDTRYPVVRVNLAAAPQLIAAATAVDLGDRITISNPPAWLPPDDIDLMAQGYNEVIGLYDWTLEFNCTPAGPFDVAYADDAVYGRADTDGSELATGATSTATSLSVATTSGPIWTTSAGDMPFDIRVAGEVMTVTNITGSSSPQTFTVTRSVNGVVKAQSSGADVRLAHPSIAAL